MPGNKEKFQKLMTQGHSAAWDMEWAKAADYYGQALAEMPDDVQAWTNLAAALYEMQNYPAALNAYKRVIQAQPNDPIIYERIAQVLEAQNYPDQAAEYCAHAAELYLQNRDVEKAIQNLSRSVFLSPENIQRRSRLALIYERLGRSEPAVREYLVVASLIQHAGQKEKAIELVNRCLQLIPNSNEARQALGLLRANQALPKPQRKFIKKSTPISEPRPVPPAQQLPKATPPEPLTPVQKGRKDALAVLASLLFDQEDSVIQEPNPKPASLQTLMRGTGPLSQVTYEKAQVMLHLSQAIDLQGRGKNEESAQELEKAIDAGLDNGAAYFTLGLLRLEAGRLESAMRNLQHAIKHPDFVFPGRLLLAQTLFRMNRLHDSALQYLEALKHADCLMFSGHAAEDLQQLYDPIIEALFQPQEGMDYAKLCNAVDALLNQPDWFERVAKARQQLPRTPAGAPPIPLAEVIIQVESSQVLNYLSSIHDLARQGLYRIAMDEAFWALQLAPTYLPLHSVMAEILLEQNQLNDAIDKYNVVARAYSARGESNRAIEIFRRIMQLAPLDLSTRKRLIEQLTAAGMLDQAVKETIELGDVYYRLAELEKAREAYQKALSITQQFNMDAKWAVQVLHHLADIDLQLLDWRRALRLFQQIRAIDPTDEKAGMNIIDLNLRMGNETQALAELGNYTAFLNRTNRKSTALELLETLASNNPDMVAIRQTLAEQYEAMGMYPDAIEQWDLVGDLRLEAGDPNGAIYALEKLIALKPPNVSEYIQVLKELKANR